MLANTPRPEITFARCGHYEVHLISMPCPFCSRMLRASDVKIDHRGELQLICSGGCHKDILKIGTPA
jgi:hypothetical protein